MLTLRSLNRDELARLTDSLGWEPWRAKSIWRWLWHRGVTDPMEITDLPLAHRQRLAEISTVGVPAVRDRRADSSGTEKFTFVLTDGAVIESVVIRDRERRTVCVSTQAGCPLGCRFCATGQAGFTRNLTWYEIAGQVVDCRRLGSEQPTNVVLMGMGEPFLNYDASVAAVQVINAADAIGIGARHITVSTAGIPEAIRRFATLPIQVRLAVSLNAARPDLRARLMPISDRHPLESVIKAVREFVATTGRRVTFEYVLLAGVNDQPEDIRALAELLRGIPCKVNLIPFNRFPGTQFRPPTTEAVERFAQQLYPLLPAVTIRRSRGGRIAAACGQLAAGTTAGDC